MLGRISLVSQLLTGRIPVISVFTWTWNWNH